jgi:hypothetical protein
MSNDLSELLLNKTWRPTLSYTGLLLGLLLVVLCFISLFLLGVDGVPSLMNAGNVLRAYTTLMLSFRTPPTLNPEVAKDAITRAILSAKVNGVVTVDASQAAAGWNAPECEVFIVLTCCCHCFKLLS